LEASSVNENQSIGIKNIERRASKISEINTLGEKELGHPLKRHSVGYPGKSGELS